MDPYADSVERMIQTSYQKFQKEPRNPAHSLAIATLYERRGEYATAIPWLENALGLVRKQGDAVLEGRLHEARVRALKKELSRLQISLDSDRVPDSRAEYQKLIDARLDDLSRLLKSRKRR